MNYLDLVNNVLKRIREDTVSTVNQTDYSALIGALVNDAKTSVEQAWNWSHLRNTIVVTTSSGTSEYSLVGSGDDSYELLFRDTTNSYNLMYQAKNWVDSQPSSSGNPRYFSYSGIDSNGDTKVTLYPTPSSTLVLNYNGVFRQSPLSADSDVIKVPWQPVMHLAVALAVRERGETGGTSAPEYFAIADKYISDYIAIDAIKHPEEMLYSVV